jgi:hypothetical protein
LTQGAIKQIEVDRTREVLAFNKDEIELLRHGREDLWQLITHKRKQLRVHGKAWFGPLSRSEFVGVKLPVGNTEFVIRKAISAYFASKTQNAYGFYTMRIPDTGWGIPSGQGALLRLQLSLRTVEDLRNILGYLHDKFGLSNDGSFSIHQTEMCWHGSGAETFVKAVVECQARYERARLNRAHHSESVSYFDKFRDGWVLLSGQQRVGWESDSGRHESFFHRSDLAIQLPGVPVDVASYLELCRYTGNDWAQFQYVGSRGIHTRRLNTPIPLDVVGLSVQGRVYGDHLADEKQVVSGVIARNPFYRTKSLPDELLSDEMKPLEDLQCIELILCDLRDWHNFGDQVGRYLLDRLEVSWADSELLIRPSGTWDRILNRLGVGGRLKRQ